MSMFKSIIIAAVFLMQLPLYAEHPFILVREQDYTDLQERAEYEPWKSLKHKALEDASSLKFNSAESYKHRARTLSTIMSVNALAYILDEPNRQTYLEHIIQGIEIWDKSTPGNLRDELNGAKWDTTVPPGAAFMNSVLALDIVYNDLTEDQIKRAESLLSDVADYFNNTNPAWKISNDAVRGVWALYDNNPDAFDAAKTAYRTHMSSYLSEDGVFLDGPGYALARLTNVDREQKHLFMDILEYQGADHWYDDPQMVACYEWMTGSALSPTKQNWTFGDTAPERFISSNKSGLLRAGSFSATAGAYARALQAPESAPGRLSTYLTYNPHSNGSEASSRIYTDGGAFFRERNGEDHALAAALWNTKTAGDHAHFDVNSITLAGYGSLLMANSGYNGWGRPYKGFSWDYIKKRAVSSNTVLIDYSVGEDRQPSTLNNHVQRHGSGITSGFTAADFDYASASSGNAIPNGTQNRALAFVHSQDGMGGYFVLWDTVVAKEAGAYANVIFHPYSANYTVLDDGCAYQWDMAGENHPKLSIHFGTEADSVEFHDGATASFSWKEGLVGKYLKANFLTSDTDAHASILSVLYPSDDAYPEPPIARIEGDHYSGLTIGHHPGVVDYVINADETAEPCNIDDITLQADQALFRKDHGKLKWFFAKGVKLLDNSGTFGFSSEKSALVYIKADSGRVELGEPSVMTFYRPKTKSILLDGKVVPVGEPDDGGMRLLVPAGKHSLYFAESPLIRLNGDARPDFFKSLAEGKKQTVVFYGTSLTVTGEWTRAMAQWFEKRYPGQVTTINAGGSGQNSDWGLGHVQKRVIEHDPDLVVIEFAYNDAHEKFQMPIERGLSNLDAIVSRIRANNPDVTIVLQTMNDGWDAPNGNRSRSVRPQLEAYNQNYRIYADKNGYDLLDHFIVWHALKLYEPQKYQEYVPDGSHPNKEGSLLYTWPLMKSWLEEKSH
ncbi:GDSL-type esterase/lipase family protein [Ruficoccus sp. ZRK36]|uniref:GDSL-type esterase/lipase family protein n=1 Tax=Ruficoccus sp. ZRK36 TaxID=2866311 RepID=UPI001C73A955|nr:GDSL-type esterase/lipase family protein [Ruficoccus sp. ZRK36]QYY37263.1 hypothetical protein K0V07_07210 [Ruficoccus sp. ZRK36]